MFTDKQAVACSELAVYTKFCTPSTFPVQVLLINISVGSLAVITMLLTSAPWFKRTASRLRSSTGTEHLALWMGIYRVLLVPAAFLAALLLRSEIYFYLIRYPTEVALGALALGAIAAYSLNTGEEELRLG